MSESEAEKPKILLKKKKTRLKKLKNEENEEEKNNMENSDNEGIEKKKKKKRSKTAYKRKKKKINLENESDNVNNSDKDDNNKDDNENENEEEKPKTRKKRKKKKKIKKNKSSHNSDNDENIDNNYNIKINIDNEDNEDNENNENDKPKKRKRKKRRKKKEITNNEEEENNNEDNNEDNNDINEEQEEKKKKKRRRKKRKKKIKEEDDNEDNQDKDEEESNNEEERKMAKTLKKKKKRKKKEKKLSFDNNEKVLIYEPDKNEIKKEKNQEISKPTFTLRAAKKTLLSNNITEENNLKDEIRIPKKEKEIIDKSKYDYYDINWKYIKEKSMKEIEEKMKELNIYDTIDIALISTTSLIKKEYGNFLMTNHHEICPIKNYNNINWAKEPFSLLKDKLYELSSPGNILEKNNLFDFSNRACLEYEIYDAKINLFKISGNDITLGKKLEPENYCFISKDDKDKLKPTLILFFSLNNEKSIILFKEILFFLEDYKEDIIFMPINAPLIQEEKNIFFVLDMLSRYKVYKKGDKFEIYFCSDDALNKRFKYITDDNKKNVINKIVYLDVIDNKLTVRAIRDLDDFTFNLIDKKKTINKESHKSIIKNLIKLKNSPSEFLKDTPLIEPFNCNWIFKKAKIYHITKEDKKLEHKLTIYDSLTGSTKGEHLYLQERKMYENLFKLFRNFGYYQLRFSPIKFSLTSGEINKLIIDEMNKCLQMNEKLKNVKYQSIFQTQQIILSIGSQFDINKFMPIESNSFKLEIKIDINLFEELEPLNIIGAMQGLTLYTYFNNCDYIACYPKLGEIFPNKLTLTNSENFQEIQVDINSEGDKPSLLIIFSLALQNFFAYNELSSRFKLMRYKLEKLYKNKKINIYLIYRGEPSNFSERFDQIRDDKIFPLCDKLYIKTSSNLKFPLIYQNNDIESTDSQIMAFILNKENKLFYTGNLEDIHIDKTFESLINDTNEIIFKNNSKLKYQEFKPIIKKIKTDIENIFEKELNKEDKLLYRPFFSISYNTYTNFENESTDNIRYINHNRLRILIKEKHKNIFKNNEEFKKLSNELKIKYDISTLVVCIECSDIHINSENNCDNCKELININNSPYYFEEESQKIFCENCGEEYSNDIKNENYITYFNTNEIKGEVIQEMYTNFLKRNENINPVLGDKCKICKNKIGDIYFLNMTHFNIEYCESPIIPIDICENCFNEMKNGEPFLNDGNKRLNYEKFGIDYRHMIYRKIYVPLTGRY